MSHRKDSILEKIPSVGGERVVAAFYEYFRLGNLFDFLFVIQAKCVFTIKTYYTINNDRQAETFSCKQQ